MFGPEIGNEGKRTQNYKLVFWKNAQNIRRISRKANGMENLYLRRDDIQLCANRFSGRFLNYCLYKSILINTHIIKALYL